MNRVRSLFAFIPILVGCSEAVLPSASDEILFMVNYPSTKVSGSNFESGDAISIYAVEYDEAGQNPLQVSGNFLNNEKLIFNGKSWNGERKLYWSSKPCDFYAVFPYQNLISSVDEFHFSIFVDQSGEGYYMSDLMYASAKNVSRTDGGVNLKLDHLMSKLVVNLIKGPDFEGEIPSDAVVHIYNTTVDSYVNLTTGSLEKNAFGSKKTITMKKIETTRFEAVVVPQNIEKKTPLVEITMGGIAYLLEYSMSFRPGYCHTINITLNTSPEQEQIEISIDPSHGWD